MSYVMYDIVYFIRLMFNLRHRSVTYDILISGYDIVCDIVCDVSRYDVVYDVVYDIIY